MIGRTALLGLCVAACQQGRLVAAGAEAPVTCKRPVWAPFVAYRFGAPGADNLPVGQGVVETLSCMTAVGTAGCGFEHPLESVYAALKPDGVGITVDRGGVPPP